MNAAQLLVQHRRDGNHPSIPKWLVKRVIRIKQRRPDVVIGFKDDPYLLRWHVLPKNPIFNVFIHEFLRSDEDRAPHDHPWFNLSLLVDGPYIEHTIGKGGVHHRQVRIAGDIKARLGTSAHRIELVPHPVTGQLLHCTTIFITFWKHREWGFHCRNGWVHNQLFNDSLNSGLVGRGCDQ